jgi:hypothetical protein
MVQEFDELALHTQLKCLEALFDVPRLQAKRKLNDVAYVLCACLCRLVVTERGRRAALAIFDVSFGSVSGWLQLMCCLLALALSNVPHALLLFD